MTKKLNSPSKEIDNLKELFSTGDYQAAVNYGETLVKEFPDSADLSNNLGVIYSALNDYDSSFRNYVRAVELRTEFPQAYNNLGNLQKKHNKYKLATDSYKKALQLDGNFSEAHFNLGIVSLSMGDVDLAIRSFQKNLEIKPLNIEAMINLGLSFREKQQFRSAEIILNKAISLDLNNAGALNNLGLVLKDKGEIKRAEALIRQAHEKSPNDPGIKVNLSIVSQALGDLDSAIQYCDHALEIEPNYVAAFSVKGDVYRQKKDYKRALNIFESGLELAPKNLEILNNIGAVFQDLGRLDMAIVYFKRALVGNNKFIDPFLNLQNLNCIQQGYPSSTEIDIFLLNDHFNQKLSLDHQFHIAEAIRAYINGDFRKSHAYLKKYHELLRKYPVNSLPEKKGRFCAAYDVLLQQLMVIPLKKVDNQRFVYHVGESHCLSFANREIILNGLKHTVIPKISFGVKAFHLRMQSQNSYKSVIEHHLKELKNRATIFLSVGEIDCRPDEGITYTAKKRGLPPSTVARETVSKYVEWLFFIEREVQHQFYVFNVPAQKYDHKLSKEVNYEVSGLIHLFNRFLEEYLESSAMQIVDVHSITNDKAGFSSGELYCDNRHLGVKALTSIENIIKSKKSI